MNPTRYEMDLIRAFNRREQERREANRANGRDSQFRRRDTKKGHRR